MKKISILLFFLMTLATSMIQAQNENSDSKFYIKVYGGYGLLTPGSYKLVSSSNAGGATGNISLSKKGLGSGIRAGGGIGVIVSDFLNIGADVEYLSGTALKSSTSYLPATGFSYISETEITYSSLSITPHVIFKAISEPDYLIYNKLGLLLNLPTDLHKHQKDSSFDKAIAYTYSADKAGVYRVGLTVGLNVALGVQFRISDKLRGYGEIFGNYLVLSPTDYEEKRTEMNNGVTTDSEHRVTYIKEGQTSYSMNGNNTTSTLSVAGNRFNMNTLGINIGIAFRF
jgi:hypothetical protein